VVPALQRASGNAGVPPVVIAPENDPCRKLAREKSIQDVRASVAGFAEDCDSSQIGGMQPCQTQQLLLESPDGLGIAGALLQRDALLDQRGLIE
jgi:hypothetical protein